MSFTPPTHDEIAARAFERFLARGGVHGFEVEDWLEAERELIETRTRETAEAVVPDPLRRPIAAKLAGRTDRRRQAG